MDHYRSAGHEHEQDQDGIGAIPVSLGSFHPNPPPPPPNPIRVSAFFKPCSSSNNITTLLSPKDHHHGSSSAVRNNNGSSSTTTDFMSPTAATADPIIQDHSNPIPVTISPSSKAALAAQAVKYRECLRNHAASAGGHVLDGCCEFMAGSADPLKCAACDCHRSFHRKQLSEGTSYYYSSRRDRISVPLLLPPPQPPHPHHKLLQHQQPAPLFPPTPSGVVPGSSPLVGFGGNNSGSGATTESSSEEGLDARAATPHGQQNMAVSKKRFRTRFTAEQKEKMLCFAERAGWRMQRQDDATIENLCRELGVRRHVLKVWMHNNKHSIRKQQQEAQLQQQGPTSADSASPAPTSQPPPPAVFGHVRN